MPRCLPPFSVVASGSLVSTPATLTTTKKRRRILTHDPSFPPVHLTINRNTGNIHRWLSVPSNSRPFFQCPKQGEPIADKKRFGPSYTFVAFIRPMQHRFQPQENRLFSPSSNSHMTRYRNNKFVEVCPATPTKEAEEIEDGLGKSSNSMCKVQLFGEAECRLV